MTSAHTSPRPWRAAKLAEGFLRVHHLLSIAATNLALIALFISTRQACSSAGLG